MKFLTFLFFLLLASSANATSTIDPTQPAASSPLASAPVRSNFNAAYNDINGLQAKFPVSIANGGTAATTAQGALDSLSGASGATQGLLGRSSGGAWAVVTNLSQLCGTAFSGTTCASLFQFADPRNFGGFCDNNTNNNVHDDSTAIMSALASGYPVVIPYPYCKVSSGVNILRNGSFIFSMYRGATYNNSGSAVVSPYVFVPNNLGQRPAFDVNGYDSNAFMNLAIECNFDQLGSGGISSNYSGGIRSGVTFTDLETVSIGNCGVQVGSATGVTSGVDLLVPINVSGQLLQMYYHNLHLANGGVGMAVNATDVLGTNLTVTSMIGPCITGIGAAGAFGLAGEITGVRCEFVSFGPSAVAGAPLQNNGAGIYSNEGGGSGGLGIRGLQCDHVANGPCVDQGPSSSRLALDGGFMFASGYLGTAAGGVSSHVYLEGGSSHFSMTGGWTFSTAGNFPINGVKSSGNIDYLSLGDMSTVGLGTSTPLVWGGTIAHADVRVQGTPFFINGQSLALGIGTATPNAGDVLDMSSTANASLAIGLPVGTTGQEPSGAAGMLRYNSTTADAEGYFNGAWTQILGTTAATVATTGSMSLNNGLILNWGPWTSAGSQAAVAVTYNTAFTTATYTVLPTCASASTTSAQAWYDTPANSGVNLRGQVGSLSCTYLAIGR